MASTAQCQHLQVERNSVVSLCKSRLWDMGIYGFEAGLVSIFGSGSMLGLDVERKVEGYGSSGRTDGRHQGSTLVVGMAAVYECNPIGLAWDAITGSTTRSGSSSFKAGL